MRFGMRAIARAGVLVACSACREPVATPVPKAPASLVTVASPSPNATVGAIAGIAGVKVLDADGNVLRGAVVTFRISRGSGWLSASSGVSDTLGVAAVTYRAGTLVTTNELSAFVAGLAPTTFTIVTTAGATKTIGFGQRSLKYTPTIDSLFTTAVSRDTFLNANAAPVSWTARNASLISVTPSGAGAAVRALTRPGSTWLVATSGAAADSIFVLVQDSTSTPCTFLATPSAAAFPVGATASFDAGTVCVSPTEAGAEYAVVAHFNTAAYPVSQTFEVTGDGIAPPVAAFPVAPPPASEPSTSMFRSDVRFEQRMRSRESHEIGPRLAGARAAMAASKQGAMRANAVATPKVGDSFSFNVNAVDFCEAPDLRSGRIAAVSKTAIIVTDLGNPAGGFTDADYKEFAAQMDTLVLPVDTAAFGSATDVDRNGRVTMFFTRAVNELTPAGSPSGVVLGFYYLRDLLPRTSGFGDCPGSNVSELLYLLVPDSLAVINGNVRTKAYVSSSVVGTIAHEFQHLINASRRMYVNDAIRVDEDVWLSEGLSHIAEELVFFRASGLSARSNLTAAQFPPGSAARTAFDNYAASNLGRYRQFLMAPESNSPLANDDFLSTRGASWAFLRYLADRARPTDGDFWRRLVNSRWSGAANADSVLAGSGVTLLGALRDWSTAVLMDDIAPASNASLQQGTWEFQSVFPGAYGTPFGITARVLLNGVTSVVANIGGGTSYLRFGVGQNREALIRVTAQNGGPLPAGMRLTLVRLK
jgi:hypothetical protein